MADKKDNPSRTMRSDPPTHPAEVLRATPKGCMESIRNRKGVSDYIENEVEPAGTLHPSTESALEFAPEVAGQKSAKASSATGTLQPLDAPVDGGNFQVMAMAGAPVVMDPNVDPTPGLQPGGVHLMGFAAPAGGVEKLKPKAPKRKPMTALEINNHFSEIIDMLENAAVEGRDRTDLFTIQRDPHRRPAAERIPPNANAAQIRQVMLARVARLTGIPVTPLLKDIMKEELRQLLFELIEMGLVERSP